MTSVSTAEHVRVRAGSYVQVAPVAYNSSVCLREWVRGKGNYFAFKAFQASVYSLPDSIWFTVLSISGKSHEMSHAIWGEWASETCPAQPTDESP